MSVLVLEVEDAPIHLFDTREICSFCKVVISSQGFESLEVLAPYYTFVIRLLLLSIVV